MQLLHWEGLVYLFVAIVMTQSIIQRYERIQLVGLVTVEFLQFRVRGGDKVLEQHLKSCSKNASYFSKTSQNDLISCCGQFITELIVRKIKENHFFSILADEASDFF